MLNIFSHHRSRANRHWSAWLRRLAVSVMLGGFTLAQTAAQSATATNEGTNHMYGVSAGQGPHRLFLGDLNSFYNRVVWGMSIPAIILSILIFVGVSAALFYTVAKFRERDGETREPAQFHGNNTLELAMIGVPVVIVMFLTVLTVQAMARVNITPKDAYPVNVQGAQFWWNFSYPQAKLAQGQVANGNELVVPAGQRIALTITAKDVLHAFWAPNLGGQRDAIPGTTKTWTVDNDRPGIYQGNCSVLCGASHANMRFKVAVLPQDQFQTFTQAALAYKAPAPSTPQQQNGYTIFMQGKNGAVACASCHRIQGTPANGVAGPDLSFFGTRRTLGAGMWEGEAKQKMLLPWIKNSAAVKPGSLMPAYTKLSDADIQDVIAYIDTLKLPAEADYWTKVPVIK